MKAWGPQAPEGKSLAWEEQMCQLLDVFGHRENLIQGLCNSAGECGKKQWDDMENGASEELNRA